MSSARRGLVLGGGGILGAAWMVGALVALEEERGVSAVSMDLLVGTSAGSVVAAMLAGGVSVSEQLEHQRNGFLSSGPLAGVSFDYAVGGARPPALKPGLGSRALLASAARRRSLLNGPVLLAGLLPRGRGVTTELTSLVDRVTPSWPSRPDLRVVAMDYATGDRVVFGSGGPATPAEGVTASCAIPAWFSPVEIGGRSYVDGGTVSIASADLAAGRALDEVYVLAPLAAFVSYPNTAFAVRLLRRWRRPQTRQLVSELAQLRSEGTRVTVLAPGPEDLAVFGVNVMDEQRRRAVLETSLRTTRATLREHPG
jgi:NTE family protein